MKQGFWIVVKNIVRNADIVLEVLDARFPNITRISRLEKMAKEKLILVVNKVDIVSKKTLDKIKTEFKNSRCVLVSSKNSENISELKKLLKGKVAVIGYPNTGKSTLINKLSSGGKARTSSESGFTHGKQLIAGKGFMLMDTPGIVPFADRDEVRLGLVSGISPSKLENPDLVATKLIYIFKKNNPSEFGRYYDVDMTLDSYSILLEVGKKRHMLLKKGEIDERRAAVSVLVDWHNGKIKL
ncbi:MAG: 50S ribosome-binding GTPase [Candidatus Woesearchaeota archaeon]|jgi:ribosome biogenesis GTPase A|nr:50S ribosome-binding GTPase [Candidatus Woesearchaeota archaeon]MDP7476120.1 50S ribosome-binding GTPase [Candidatus Woesearchaeota archaeon]|tara:strand:- start:1067 stop:1789 length:723 start_codon:yes stop_codon:yes gene_type:complete